MYGPKQFVEIETTIVIHLGRLCSIFLEKLLRNVKAANESRSELLYQFNACQSLQNNSLSITLQNDLRTRKGVPVTVRVGCR